MMFDSDDECDLKDILEDDEDDDEDDDDYIPGKRYSDSDPEYGKRKKKSSRSSNRYVPGKRNRGIQNSSKSDEVVDVSDEEEPAEAENKDSPVKKYPLKGRPQKRKKPAKKPVEAVVDVVSDEDAEGNVEGAKKASGRGRPPKQKKPAKKPVEAKPVEAVVDISDEDGDNHSEVEQKLPIPTKGRLPAKQKTTKPKTKSPARSPRTPKAKKQKTSNEELEESPFSLRRSGRSSRARSVSYADADVSEEDMYEDEDLFETMKDISNEKKVVNKKKHVDDLWSKFKSDVTEPGQEDQSTEDNKAESENVDKNTGTINIEMKSENGKISLEEESGDTSMKYTDVKQAEPSKKKETDVTKRESETVATEKPLTNTDKDKDMDGNDNKPTSPQIASVEEKESPVIEKAQYSSATNVETPAPGSEKDAYVSGIEKEAPMSGNNKEPVVAHAVTVEAPPPTAEEKNGEHASFKDVEKYNSNGYSKVGSPLTKTENKSIDAIIKKDTVIIEEKQVYTASSSSSTTNINPNFMEPTSQLQEASMLPKTTTDKYRSSGINNFLSSGVKKTGGLSSVLNTIEKKKKISVLDKTKTDWDSYKSDLDIEEELKGNRNAGYLDRQEFLQRADYKQWENEREMRLYSNRK